MLVLLGIAPFSYIKLSFWCTLQSPGHVPQKDTYDHCNAKPNCEDCHGVPFRTEWRAAADTQRKRLPASLAVGRANCRVGNDTSRADAALRAVNVALTQP
jgi:hypothetical protein